jgi:hypothetical protein
MTAIPGGRTMGRVLSFVGLIIVVAVGSYIYMRQTQSVMTAGTSNPTATVDLIGVRNDLLNIAQAERAYCATNGKYLPLDELRSQGALTMNRSNRGPYSYSADVTDSSFRIVATYNGPASSGMPKSLSVDESMVVQEER